MINTYSQRLLTPYYGLVQIAETERARALTVDGQTWEIQFLRTGNGAQSQSQIYRRAVTISDNEIKQKKLDSLLDDNSVDERILELIEYLADISLPFPAADIHEYWLLDAKDQAPLALIFSCKNSEQMNAYPSRPEWTALPSAVMPIEMTEDEKSYASAPINYRLERLVAERAGINPKADWFTRCANEELEFPAFMLREDWQEEESHDMCQRYLTRQAPRLLMLHGLSKKFRAQLEKNARAYALEVARFYPLYPEIIDQSLMNAILVEAKLRGTTENQPSLHNRRDGIHYL